MFLRRRTVVACVIAIVATCLVAGYQVQVTVTQLSNTHQTFNDRQMRNGYVAMSDVQRLVLIMQDAFGRGAMTPEAAAEFALAADFLYVRADTFERVLSGGVNLPEADAAITALRQIQSLVDEAIASDFANLPYLSAELIDRAQTARQALVTYLDEMNRLQDRLLLGQSVAVSNQRTVIWVTLLGLSIMGIAATALLRREILSKQARLEAEKRVRHLAFFDSLTDLPNRAQFQEKLSELLKQQTSFALMLVDLDGFKQINDTYGHAAGDVVLQHVSAALSAVRDTHGGFAARLGGDEFAFVSTSADMQVLQQVCEDILTMVGRPADYEGETLQVDASIGLATSNQSGAQAHQGIDGLTRVADFALYASKSNGKRQYTIYDNHLEQQYLARRAMVDELPRAILDGSMEFYLQPKVDLQTGGVCGFEALARWRRAGVIIAPADFIDVAEESGLIGDIDLCVLQNATRDIADFNRRHGTQFSISVNFSTLHFASFKVVDMIGDALKSSGLLPHLLTIEITETIEMQDWEKAKQIVTAIRQLGVRVSIDDFGTGFSSLAYLRTTVADEIKIDRSLVQDIDGCDTSRFLLDAVLDIARNLKLRATVEGIETMAQADLVRQMGAEYAQGFYFFRPMPKEEAFAKAVAQLDHPLQISAS